MHVCMYACMHACMHVCMYMLHVVGMYREKGQPTLTSLCESDHQPSCLALSVEDPQGRRGVNLDTTVIPLDLQYKYDFQ